MTCVLQIKTLRFEFINTSIPESYAAVYFDCLNSYDNRGDSLCKRTLPSDLSFLDLK